MELLERLADPFRVRFREKLLNPLLGRSRRHNLRSDKFSIISNNCWGGHVYRFFNLPYDSPTVGLYFFSEDYVKFVYNLEYYMSIVPSFISYKASRYRDILEDRKEMKYPIGILDDIEIIFLHYRTPEEALDKWMRRKNRIHWDNLIFKMSEQNLSTLDLLYKFDNLPAEKKILFTSADYGLESQVIFYDWLGYKEVINDTLHFRKYVDLVKLINGEPFRKRQ